MKTDNNLIRTHPGQTILIEYRPDIPDRIEKTGAKKKTMYQGCLDQTEPNKMIMYCRNKKSEF